MMKLTRALVGDAVLAVVLAVLGVVTVLAYQFSGGPGRDLDAVGIALICAAGLALTVRRFWPYHVLAAETVVTTAYLLANYRYGLILGSFAVAVYTVARHRPLARAAIAAGSALPILLAHTFVNDSAVSGLLGLLPGSAWGVVPFAVGVTVRQTRQAAEQARAEALRRRVDDERLRIVQEVHDVVGHGLAAIKMQADVALHVLTRKPEQAEVALDVISRTSSEALEELRATLAVMRQAEDDTERAPTPTLERLDELRRRMGETGVDVRLVIEGERPSLPKVVDTAGYRIVQESLTNVLRHSGAREADVTVTYTPEEVRLTVTNPVTAPPVAERDGGLGIPGMRQRALSLGGTFSAGPTGDGRFEVRASLPIGGSR